MFQVMKKYQLTAPSMDQLQARYLLQYNEQLPITQYISLYDSWEAKKLPTQSEPTADPGTVVVQTTAGRQTFTSMHKKIKMVTFPYL